MNRVNDYKEKSKMIEFANVANERKPAVTGRRTETDLKSNSIKEADTNLLDNCKTLSLLSEQIPGFFYLYHQISDGNAKFPFASHGIRDIYELDPEDVTEGFGPIIKRIHKNDLERVIQSIRESAQTLKTWECEYRVILPKKGLRWLRGKAKSERQPDGTAIGIGYVIDITEEKSSALKNARLRKQFQAVLDSVPNFIYVKDLEGKYLMANKSSAEYFGLDPEEIVGKNNFDLGLSRELDQACKESDEKVIKNREPLFIPEEKFIRSDGTEGWYQTIKVPFKQIDTNSPAVLSVVTDITKIKTKEIELGNSHDIIVEQNKRLMNFAHIASHNLRNHSGNISMLLELYDSSKSVEEQQELLELLHTASNQLNESIADLNLIIDQQYKSSNELIEINLKDSVSETKNILATEILAHNVTFKEHLPNDLTLKYNPAYLESIILNLLSNAIKYRHPDRKPVITLNAYEKDNKVHFEVSDNGLGIDLEKYGDKLFGMYKTFHDNEDSNGIGLYITKNQVESMGGSVDVVSEPGKGSTFKLILASGQ